MGFDRGLFSAALEVARQRSGKSIKEIAENCGFPEGWWNRFRDETMLPSAPEIVSLCLYLDVSADWLLGIKALREAEE